MKQSEAHKLGLDNIFHANLSQYLGWFSPASFFLAFFDWTAHFRMSPDKQFAILNSALQKYHKFLFLCIQSCVTRKCQPIVQCQTDDPRFQHDLWNYPPYNIYSQNFLLWEQLWNEATQNVQGVSKHHENVVNFSCQQLLDIISPSNNPWTNPEVLSTTVRQGGVNFLNGFQNFQEDLIRFLQKNPVSGT